MIGAEDVVTRSFCGTEQYMSPEMLLQQGHNYRMDWWCVGLLMHEMISARHPFHGPTHYDTLRNMVTKQPNIDGRLSGPASDAVKAFLVKNPKARLCCKDGGIEEMKALPFFQSVDWEALYELRVPMPHVPDLRSSKDISSFESTFTNEAPVDSAPDTSDGSGKKKGGKGGGGGIMKLFGYGSGKTKSEDPIDPDAFKDFAFAKDEDLALLHGPPQSPTSPLMSDSSTPTGAGKDT
jgi:serine/threonine protein kinase